MNSTTIIAQTQRLYFRPILLEDDVHLYAMHTDKRLLYFHNMPDFSSFEHIHSFITKSHPHKKYGTGRWAILKKTDKTFIGWCGLTYLPEENHIEVDYQFLRKFRGHGYTLETVHAVLSYGFSILKLPQIYIRSYQDDETAQLIISNCNMRYLKMTSNGIKHVVTYVKDNPYMHVNPVTSKATYPVRHVVLRQGKPLTTCAFEGDEHSSTLHFGAFFKDMLIGVVSLMEQSHPKFMHTQQVQLRGMGVLPDFQDKGVGGFLIKKAEDALLERNKQFIWMNARTVAVSFYQKLGYKTYGEAFTISDVGWHYVMTKLIRQST